MKIDDARKNPVQSQHSEHVMTEARNTK